MVILIAIIIIIFVIAVFAVIMGIREDRLRKNKEKELAKPAEKL